MMALLSLRHLLQPDMDWSSDEAEENGQVAPDSTIPDPLCTQSATDKDLDHTDQLLLGVSQQFDQTERKSESEPPSKQIRFGVLVSSHNCG